MTDPLARLADSWWESLPPGRKRQIFRWIAGREAALDHPPVPGQTDILTELDRTRP